MIRNILLLLAGISLLLLTVIGIPFELKVGQVNQIGARFHFTTASRSIAALVANASEAYLDCTEKALYVVPTDRKHFDTNIPMEFQPSESQATEPRCNGSYLVLKLDTSRWLKSGVLK